MKNENKEIIEQLEERLKWYTYEASEKEFDAEEVYMISKLLQKMHENEEKDDYFNPEASLKRFQERYHITLEAGEQPQSKKPEKKHYAKGLVKAAAILALCGISCFGAVGVINAYKTGELKFFQIIYEDDRGKDVIINGAAAEPKEVSPSPSVGSFQMTEVKNKVYTSWEEVPLQEESSIWIPVSAEIQIKSIATTEWSDIEGQCLNVCYLVGEKELWCDIMIFPNQQKLASVEYSMALPIVEELVVEPGVEIAIRQAEMGDIFGECFVERSYYLFSGEFEQEKFVEIMNTLKKCSF